MAFHGHFISIEKVGVDLRKTKAVKNCPRPLAPTNIRNFFGLTRYFRSFVVGFASAGSPLTTLTQKMVKFELSEACERIFKMLKVRITSALVFTLP